MALHEQEIHPRELIAQLRKKLTTRLNKAQQKLIRQCDERDLALKATWFSQIGDSLLADQKSFPRGTSTTIIQNIHTDAIEEIQLNPKLDAQENSELWYKKARKAKRGIDMILEQMHLTEDAIKTLSEGIDRCDACSKEDVSAEDIQNEHTRLNNEFYPVDIPKDHRSVQKIDEKVPYRHYLVDGYNIYIGKNDAQNDEISVRFAKPWHIWLHVAAHAGSHVIIVREKNATEMPPEKVMQTAAAFAIWFSKAKHTSYADVHFTEARYVHKRRHAPAGEVMLDKYKSIRVAPVNPQDYFKTQSTEG